MTKIIEIKEGDFILARYVPSKVAWSEGLNFFSNEQDLIQVGIWGYGKGKELKAHTHNEIERKVNWTQEVLYVRKGQINAIIYNTTENKVAEIKVSEGDIIILLKGGHGYEVLQEGTQVLEIKNGPYLGADIDRKRI
jgi:hypothetical protein